MALDESARQLGLFKYREVATGANRAEFLDYLTREADNPGLLGTICEFPSEGDARAFGKGVVEGLAHRGIICTDEYSDSSSEWDTTSVLTINSSREAGE